MSPLLPHAGLRCLRPCWHATEAVFTLMLRKDRPPKRVTRFRGYLSMPPCGAGAVCSSLSGNSGYRDGALRSQCCSATVCACAARALQAPPLHIRPSPLQRLLDNAVCILGIAASREPPVCHGDFHVQCRCLDQDERVAVCPRGVRCLPAGALPPTAGGIVFILPQATGRHAHRPFCRQVCHCDAILLGPV